MRGKPETDPAGHSRMGITPADAGKTAELDFGGDNAEDHPRGCGENLHLDKQSVIPARITPADAGKTMSSSSAAAKRWDHPRGCGENRLCTSTMY